MRNDNLKLKIFLLAIIFGGIFGLVENSQATIINVTNCSQANVQSAVDAAVAGDTVYLNCTSATWSSYVSVTKGITIKGNGSDATTLTANNTTLFSVSLTSGANFRITDLGFAGTVGGGGGLEEQLIRLSGDESTIWNSLRADHLKFTNINGHAFTIDPWWLIPSHPKALFDHITLLSNQWSRLLKIAGNNSTWQSADQYGTDWAIFIEDSTFTWTGGANGDLTDTEHGVRLVVRHNIINGGDIQMHDTGSTPAARGQRMTEVYNNTINCVGGNCNNLTAVALRGGGAIVYDNTITGDFWTPGFAQVWRATVGSGFLGAACTGAIVRACNTPTFMHCSGGNHAVCSGDGDCYGSASGSCIVACTSNSDCPIGTDGSAICLATVDNVDGSSGGNGYPCRDQTGWGQEYGAGGRNQYPSPVYWYNNGTTATCATGGACNDSATIAGDSAWFAQDRDFCYHDPSIDCGTKTSWNYIPYAYPHPLQGEIDITPPNIPSGLMVN